MRNLFVLSALAVVGLTAQAAFAGGPFFHDRTDTPKMQNATVGRYVYLGDAPRFESEDLELFASKIALTLRVKGWVKPELQKQYASLLMNRWMRVYTAFQDSRMRFIPLRSLQKEAERAKDRNLKSWLKVASQYSKSPLENYGVDIYASGLSDEQYRDELLTAQLRYYFDNPAMTIDDGVKLAADSLTLESMSPALFKKHLGASFTQDITRDGYVGFVTYVFPIAATAEGPFDQPSEGLKRIGFDASMEARIWSDKWQDEFGGFPFMLINEAGVAFHGPITNKSGLDNWFLRRDYVSHGCFRMDSSDVLELRNIFPAEFRQLNNKKRGIKLVVTEWPDVTDVNGDGKYEAVDVQYYELPMAISPATEVKSMVASAQKSYFTKHFTAYNGKLPSKNRFDEAEGKFYGLPKYELVAGKLARTGTWDGVPIWSAPYRGNRIVQYEEKGLQLRGMDDMNGKYPPTYFLQ